MTDAYVPKADGPEMLKPKRRSITSVSVEMSPWADCKVCEFATTEGPSSLARAQEHAQESGHEVVVDEIRRTVVTAS